LIKDAQRRGLVAQNVAQPVSVEMDNRDKPRPKIGVDIPDKDEIRSIAEHCKPNFRPLFLTAAFTGMRASELRGLVWSCCDFTENKIHVTQRADRYNSMGAPKSKTGHRVIPMAPPVRNALLEWREQCPKSKLDLVFPSKVGTIQYLANIWTQSY